MNFALMKHHQFSLTELDAMMPFERDVYIVLVKQWLEEEKERMQQQAQHR